MSDQPKMDDDVRRFTKALVIAGMIREELPEELHDTFDSVCVTLLDVAIQTKAFVRAMEA